MSKLYRMTSSGSFESLEMLSKSSNESIGVDIEDSILPFCP